MRGADSYIQKPVDINQFCGTLNPLELYWLSVNVVPRREPFAKAEA
jgi:hypothetical protein